ncbi:F-box only protein 7 isoform X2 [Patella vulgata]|uniref:F-box only protein 7 isoform X2 n=1 Tax=Patella vulgata TaxID=6465 RepID=UPI0021801034|nr:F-box only protein 7 isoform X2 [Patella vulgata]
MHHDPVLWLGKSTILLGSVKLSLNGVDSLEEDEKTLEEFGIVSGDLVFVLQESEQLNKRHKTEPQAAEHQASTTYSRDSGQSSSGQIQHKNVCTSVSEESDHETIKDHEVSEMESDDFEDNKCDPRLVTKCLQEPNLCRESSVTCIPSTLNQLYCEACCTNKNDAVWVAIHTLMVESGYTSVSQDASSQVVDKCQIQMPNGWKAANHYQGEYHHLNLSPDVTCKVIGVAMGSQLVVQGKLASSYETKNIQIKPDDYITSLETDGNRTFKNLHRLSLLIKDGIALPLLQELNSALGLPQIFGYLGLNYESQLKILSYLDCGSLLRMGEVCKQLNNIYKDPFIWRKLYLTTFKGGSSNTDLSQNWYQIYKQKYKARKEYLKRIKHSTFVTPSFDFNQPRHYSPFAPVFPNHGIIGGDYDLNPHFHGIPDPMSGRRGRPGADFLRPRYDPIGPLPDMNPLPGRGRGANGNNRHWFGNTMRSRFF